MDTYTALRMDKAEVYGLDPDQSDAWRRAIRPTLAERAARITESGLARATRGLSPDGQRDVHYVIAALARGEEPASALFATIEQRHFLLRAAGA